MLLIVAPSPRIHPVYYTRTLCPSLQARTQTRTLKRADKTVSEIPRGGEGGEDIRTSGATGAIFISASCGQAKQGGARVERREKNRGKNEQIRVPRVEAI